MVPSNKISNISNWVIFITLLFSAFWSYAQGDEPCDFSAPGAGVPRWHPTANSIIYRVSGSTNKIVSMDINNMQTEEILSTEKSLGPPAYSNDGKFITWNEGSYKDKVMTVYVMELETQLKKILTRIPYFVQILNSRLMIIRWPVHVQSKVGI